MTDANQSKSCLSEDLSFIYSFIYGFWWGWATENLGLWVLWRAQQSIKF